MSLIVIRDVVKAHGGLRPFRLKSLTLGAGESLRIDGPDRAAAAVLTDLVTGTALPDSGVVTIDGRATSELADQDEWLALLDRFGIVNDRVVLLEGLTVAQNLAIPVTLDVDPLPASVRRTVESLAREVGLDAAQLDTPLHEAPPVVRSLVRVGRAVALAPAVVLMEHPSADLAEPCDVAAIADAIRRVRARGTAIVLVSSDPRLPRDVTERTLIWRATTGETQDARGWRRWFT
jgi:ABC-type transporter Mla maintaining outer membrane lipid asymmetry ATPase subunit MlaF